VRHAVDLLRRRGWHVLPVGADLWEVGTLKLGTDAMIEKAAIIEARLAMGGGCDDG
jgi:hypothetical protein